MADPPARVETRPGWDPPRFGAGRSDHRPPLDRIGNWRSQALSVTIRRRTGGLRPGRTVQARFSAGLERKTVLDSCFAVW